MKTPAALALLLWILAWPAPGMEPAVGAPDNAMTDSLHRCIGTDGLIIFTDRRCADLQAVESPRKAAASGPGATVRVRSCAHNQDDLLFGVRSALESGDVNQLAGFYHWPGMGTAEGYRVMERLSALSARPLVDVQLVTSGAQEDFSALASDWIAQEPDRIGQEGTETAVAPPHPARVADRLRVDQMRGDDDVAAQITYFHLRSNAGCWWLQF